MRVRRQSNFRACNLWGCCVELDVCCMLRNSEAEVERNTRAGELFHSQAADHQKNRKSGKRFAWKNRVWMKIKCLLMSATSDLKKKWSLQCNVPTY